MSTDNTPDGLREAVEALATRWLDHASEGAKVGVRPTMLWSAAAQHLRRILAEHPATPAEVEWHVVHVTAEPVAEDVVWCETCEEEWVTSGAPEWAAPPAEPNAGDVDGLSDLRDVIESGWEDEPTDAERELSATVARNILASDWLATRTRMAAETGEKRGAERALREAADAMDDTDDPDAIYVDNGDIDIWLRARADRIGGE